MKVEILKNLFCGRMRVSGMSESEREYEMYSVQMDERVE